MDTLNLLFQGLGNILQFHNLLWVTFGGILGIIVGALPGMGSASGCALLLPLTFKMEPTTAIITLGALYFGNMFGGAISAILINIPGDAPAVMTAIDGNKMAVKGEPGKALFYSFTASACGGMLAAIMLTLMGSAMATIGLAFGPAQMAMLIFLAMTSIGWVLGESPAKGLATTAIGLIMASIGMDAIEGVPRMTFGSMNLVGGITFVPVVIGLFGFSQVIKSISEPLDVEYKFVAKKIRYRDSVPSLKEYIKVIPTILRSSVFGFFVGVLPGSGATMASFLAYLTEKRIARKDSGMGEGAPRGICAPESANNAASIGSFAPLLSLGIPGSGTSAILLGGLMMWGLQPGPLLMTKMPEFAWSLIASMYVADIILALICLGSISVLMYILKVPNKILIPLIITVCIIGAYSVNNNIFDVYVMIISGVGGYFLSRYNFPLAPMALAMVLGPTLETSIRQSLLISKGSLRIFITGGVSIGLFIVAIALIAIPIVMSIVKKYKEKKEVSTL